MPKPEIETTAQAADSEFPTNAALRAALDSESDLVSVQDRDGRLILLSQSMAEFVLRFVAPSGPRTAEDLLGHSVFDLFAGSDLQWLLQADEQVIATGEGANLRRAIDWPQSGERILEINKAPFLDESGKIIGVISRLRDITEQVNLEMSLRQAQKLEAVGQLAAGIAHEINTPVQFIGDSVYFLRQAFAAFLEASQVFPKLRAEGGGIDEFQKVREELDLDYLYEKVPRSMDRIVEGVQRVSDIVKALKEFSYPDQREKAEQDLNKAVKNTLLVARNELKYVADVDTELGEIPSVLCHLGDVNQVILGILLNAAYAVKERVGDSGSKGKITVSTYLEAGMVVIAISDTGGGVPLAIRERIFDPFFTTKEIGKGSGQGLAIARKIVVDGHGGVLDFESIEGVGTTFFVRLPAMSATVDSELLQ